MFPQTIQHRLAAMKTELAVNRAFTDQCIELHNQGKLDGGMASMCKYWITDLQNRITYECVQLHGGWGYMWEYPICKAYVDAKVSEVPLCVRGSALTVARAGRAAGRYRWRSCPAE